MKIHIFKSRGARHSWFIVPAKNFQQAWEKFYLTVKKEVDWRRDSSGKTMRNVSEDEAKERWVLHQELKPKEVLSINVKGSVTVIN